MMRKSLFFLFFFVSVAFLNAGEYSLRDFALSRVNGIYSCGETAEITGTLMKKSVPVTEGSVRVLIRWEGKEVAVKEIACNGKPFKASWTSITPGWVYFGIQILDKEGKVVEKPGKTILQKRKTLLLNEAGAMFSPERIRTKVLRPPDFEAFWKCERAKLDKVPLKVELTPVDSGEKGVLLYILRAYGGTDRPVTGYLAVPAGAKAKSCPALVDFLSWSWCDANRMEAVRNAKNGVLALAVSWHGFEAGKEAGFYLRNRKEFNPVRFMADREKWHFHEVFLRVMRALDVVKQRSEWNGKELIVQGGSLGGAQAFAAAALDRDVTLALVSVPGFCEFQGDLAGRKRAIPLQNFNTVTEKMFRTLAYHDLANFAPMIRCEIFLCTGFADELCPPSNMMAVYNNLPSGTKKDLYTNPLTGHYGTTTNIKGNTRMKKFFENIKVRNYMEKE